MRLNLLNTSANHRIEPVQIIKPQNLKLDSVAYNSSLLSSGLFYQLHKEDELEKTMYQDDFYDLEEEDEFYPEEDGNRDNYEDDYEYDYHRHK